MPETFATEAVHPDWKDQYRSESHAAYYAEKRDATALRRLSNRFELAMMRKALRRVYATAPFHTVLDCASGTGRFLPVLAEFGVTVLAMDTSSEMLLQGRRHHGLFKHPPTLAVGSALSLPLRTDSVDLVFCARLIQHFPDPESRIQILSEFARVARVGVVVSFFDACSFRAWRRAHKKYKPSRRFGRHAVTRAQCAREARQAGLITLGMNALLRYHAEITAAAFLVDMPSSRCNGTVTPS